MRSRSLGTLAGFICLLLAPALLVGCKSSSFLGKRYDNFTAYYNTFYNAKRSYRTGVDSRERRDEKVDRTRYIGVFVQQNAPLGGGRDFEDAVLKSADVLREHPESKWVDDALLLIGKSYFYENNFVGAQQKFEEAIDLATGLEGEARFWLARTLSASGDYEQAENVITEALAEEGGDRRWQASLRLVLGELRARQGDWNSAATELDQGLDEVRDREVAVRANFLLAQVLESLERYPEAIAAYRETLGRRPDYELAYAAEYSAIRVEGTYVDAEAALAALRKMERDDKHFSYRAELAVLRADILRAMEEADAAYNVYDELLYDPAFAAQVSRLRGRIHYALAALYRDLDQDYVSAAAHFDTASAALRTSLGPTNTVVDPLTIAPEAIRDAQELKEAFGAYASAFREVDRLDSLLWLGEMDDSTFAAKVLDLRRERARELEERQRLQEQRQIERAFQQVGGSGALDNRGLPEGKIIPSAGGAEQGFLFHDDPVMKQEGRMSFVRLWGERPLVQNWRRMEAVAGAEFEDVEGEEQEEEFELAEDQLPEVDISAVPRDSLAQAEMREERSVARYDVGTSLFLGIGRPDSAASWYRLVLDDQIQGPVARRALYALAEIQQALGDSLAATGLYRQILNDYPDTEFAGRIREMLDMPPSVDAVADSLARAEAAYEQNYLAWEDRKLEDAMNGMLATAGTYPTTAVLPKALLAAGSVFMEMAERDSLDVAEPMPIAVSDSLLITAGLITPPEPHAPDSTLAVADSLGAVAAEDDSLGTMAAGADSLGLDPGYVARVDSAAVPAVDFLVVTAPDSLAIPAADSLAIPAADSLVVTAPDSLAIPVADSLVGTVADTLVGPASDSLAGPAADSLAIPASDSLAVPLSESLEAPAVEQAPSPEPEEVVIDDSWREVTLRSLLTHIRSSFSGSPYSGAAGEVLSAMDAIEAEEQARLESIRAALAADSLALVAVQDSLARIAAADSVTALPPAAADSLAAVPQVATDSLAQVIGADSLGVPGEAVRSADVPDVASADSLIQVDAAADQMAATDSLAQQAQEPADDTPEKGMSLTPVQPDSVSTVIERAAPIGMAGARDRVDSESSELRVVESAGLDPLEMSEEEEAWSGWTVVLSQLNNLAQAPAVRDNLAETIQGKGTPEIWTGSWDEEQGVLIILGRLSSKEEVVEFAAGLGRYLPEDAFLLHILPKQ